MNVSSFFDASPEPCCYPRRRPAVPRTISHTATASASNTPRLSSSPLAPRASIVVLGTHCPHGDEDRGIADTALNHWTHRREEQRSKKASARDSAHYHYPHDFHDLEEKHEYGMRVQERFPRASSTSTSCSQHRNSIQHSRPQPHERHACEPNPRLARRVSLSFSSSSSQSLHLWGPNTTTQAPMAHHHSSFTAEDNNWLRRQRGDACQATVRGDGEFAEQNVRRRHSDVCALVCLYGGLLESRERDSRWSVEAEEVYQWRGLLRQAREWQHGERAGVDLRKQQQQQRAASSLDCNWPPCQLPLSISLISPCPYSGVPMNLRHQQLAVLRVYHGQSSSSYNHREGGRFMRDGEDCREQDEGPRLCEVFISSEKGVHAGGAVSSSVNSVSRPLTSHSLFHGGSQAPCSRGRHRDKTSAQLTASVAETPQRTLIASLGLSSSQVGSVGSVVSSDSRPLRGHDVHHIPMQTIHEEERQLPTEGATKNSDGPREEGVTSPALTSPPPITLSSCATRRQQQRQRQSASTACDGPNIAATQAEAEVERQSEGDNAIGGGLDQGFDSDRDTVSHASPIVSDTQQQSQLDFRRPPVADMKSDVLQSEGKKKEEDKGKFRSAVLKLEQAEEDERYLITGMCPPPEVLRRWAAKFLREHQQLQQKHQQKTRSQSGDGPYSSVRTSASCESYYSEAQRRYSLRRQQRGGEHQVGDKEVRLTDNINRSSSSSNTPAVPPSVARVFNSLGRYFSRSCSRGAFLGSSAGEDECTNSSLSTHGGMQSLQQRSASQRGVWRRAIKPRSATSRGALSHSEARDASVSSATAAVTPESQTVPSAGMNGELLEETQSAAGDDDECGSGGRHTWGERSPSPVSPSHYTAAPVVIAVTSSSGSARSFLQNSDACDVVGGSTDIPDAIAEVGGGATTVMDVPAQAVALLGVPMASLDDLALVTPDAYDAPQGSEEAERQVIVEGFIEGVVVLMEHGAAV